MKILALDSSGLVASVAVLEDDNCIAEYTINYKKIIFWLKNIKNRVFILLFL